MNTTIGEIERIRYIYLPSTIRCMLLAESPPGDGRFFYSPDSTKFDYLFLSTMDCLYPEFTEAYRSCHNQPQKKYKYLCRFRSDGFFLFDIYRDRDEIREIGREDVANRTISRLSELCIGQAPIIITKATVYDVLASSLLEAGISLIKIRIPFPSHHWQDNSKREFKKALRLIGWNNGWSRNKE